MPQAKRRLNLLWLGLLLFAGLGTAGFVFKEIRSASAKLNQPPSDSIIALEASSTKITASRRIEPWGIANVVNLRTSSVSVAVANELQPIDEFVEPGQLSFVLNGGFFDPQNGKTTSHLIAQGQVVGNPADNERLMGNTSLEPYLPQILNRSEFRAYRCEAEDALRHDIVFHDAPTPENCTIESAVGAGPQLLPEDTSVAEAFVAYEEGEIIRDAIGSMQPNARSAIGLNDAGEVYLIMIEQNENSSGLTLAGLAEFAASLGVTKLLNLDGGSSSSIRLHDGQMHFGRVDAEGNPIQRPVKSVVFADIFPDVSKN